MNSELRSLEPETKPERRHPLGVAGQSVALPVCVVNQHGRLIYWNHYAADFFGVSAATALGQEWHGIMRTVTCRQHRESARIPETQASRADVSLRCCALCQTRSLLRNGEPGRAVDVTLSINGCYREVTMVPLPATLAVDACIAFIILERELCSAAERGPQPIPIRSRVRRLDNDRIIDELTARERQILACVVNGLDARGISAHLGISHATARNYVQRILTKLGVHNKAEAVSVALTYNLLAS